MAVARVRVVGEITGASDKIANVREIADGRGGVRIGQHAVVQLTAVPCDRAVDGGARVLSRVVGGPGGWGRQVVDWHGSDVWVRAV